MKSSEKYCENCPNRNVRPCEKWVDETWGLIETNVATGEERLMTGCFYQVQLKMMRHVIVAANRSSATAEHSRNQILQGIRGIFQELDGSLEGLVERVHRLSSKRAGISSSAD